MKSIGLEEEALYRHCKNSSQVIIFIHGILEAPKQFSKLAEFGRQEGYSTCIFLLPGHGGSSKNFAQISYKAWIQYVSTHILQLTKRYKEILLVGHSMGALLAICESANRPKGIKALFLINPPLCIRLWPRVIKSAVTISLGKIKASQAYTRAEYRAMGVEPVRFVDSIGWISRYSELLSIVAYTRKQISKVSLPIFLVFAAKDEFVSPKSYQYFGNYQGKLQMLYLADSGHFCYHHSDLLKLEKAYLKFIRAERND